jgi:hypothetical protein
MKKLKATWQVDTKVLADFQRGYEMNIEPGGLYEVWLSLEERPKPAVAIRYLENIDIWEVLVDGQVITQDTRRIFRTGTAKPSPSALAEIQQMIADQVRHMEDQKILKFLSETT